MRCALLLVVLVGCATVPQPKRTRIEVHAISGTANAASRNAHQRQLGGGARWSYNDGAGLVAQVQLTCMAGSDLAVEPRLRETYALVGVSAGGGRVGRLTSLEGGLSTINAESETLSPWLRMTIGSMPLLRVGMTLGAEDPLFLSNFIHLHGRLLLQTHGLPVELQVGIASANRYLLIESPNAFNDSDQLEQSDSGDGDRSGVVLTGEVVWRGPIIGLRGLFAMGDVDVAQLGVFYDFE